MPDSITVEDLLANNYRSTPRNKLIADFCKSLGVIEKYGSGISRIVNYCKAGNYPIPEFQNISEGFMVTFFSTKNETIEEKVGEKVGENLTKNQNLILSFIQANQNITAVELSTQVGISKRKIEENIHKLKDTGKLKRIGPAKGGHWQITK